MNKTSFPLLLSVVMAVLISFSGCNKTTKNEISHSSFHPRVAAFTSGYIATNGSFTIEFNGAVQSAEPGAEAPASVATISPKVKGSWVWIDNKTLQFNPASKLESGKTYQITILLKKLFDNEKEDFFFEVATIPQNYRLTYDYLSPSTDGESNSYRLTGRLSVADDISDAEAEAMVSASANNKAVSISWQHPDGKNHHFEVSPINRKESAYNLILKHSGATIGVAEEGKEEILIPAIGDFSVLHVETEQQPRQLIRVVFSSALESGRDITGLYELSSDVTTTHLLNENTLEIYPGRTIAGDFELRILPGIRSSLGDISSETERFQLSFASLDPAVEFIGDGTIMPSSDQLLMHFKAVSLKSVIVRIIKIHESNIPHFLQVNSLSGSSQLKRAGRLVHQSVISLEKDATLDLNRWNSFALDLSKMIKPDPGSIYRVELGFERMDAIVPCNDEEESSLTQQRKWMDDSDFWDNPDDYYSEYPYEYEYWDWYERDNPCDNAYYQRSKWAVRNVLASNIAVIAKRGNVNKVNVYITDITTTAPMASAEVEVLNFQLQLLGKGSTNSEGMAVIEIPKGEPFLLLAKKDAQKGYLRLDPWNSLSISQFDVSGQTLRDGLKGFIYGERGVWRPGDSIFVSFIAEDRDNRLPANHPVSFELIDPRGQLVKRMVASHPKNLIYSFKTRTAEDAPTGFWLARVTMGDARFEQQIRIETIKPNRLRIELGFEDEILSASKAANISFKSEWLHGAPASGLKADVRVNTKASSTTFPAYPNYVFDDASRRFEQSEMILFDGRLNESGETNFTLPSATNYKSSGFLTAVFTSRVYEEGGSFSIGQTQKRISTYKNYVGIKVPQGDRNNFLLTDQNYSIEVATVNESGKAVSLNNIRYKIYKINWRWWWDRTDEDLARYVSSGAANLVSSGALKTIDGKASIPFKIEHPEWGRFLIKVEDYTGGHSASSTVLVDWPGWAQKTGKEGSEGATFLNFAADKDKYEPGQIANVTFPSSGEGRALVTIENGSRVISSRWVKPEPESTSFSFEVTNEMTPNIYVHISLLQPHKRKNNDLPIRLYGLIPLSVHNPESKLSPTIKSADEWRPMQKATIEVSEANNREMSYTLAVVDEGLLDLTNFKTPDAWQHFNAREALGVKTWDLFDMVLGAYGGRIEQIFGIGGGDELNADAAKNQNRRFEPMVKFMGPFNLNKRGKNKHEIEIPNYTGSVRMMVIATNGEATGSAEKRVAVKQALMVWSSLPRVMGPGETVLLPVTVFASGKATGKVKVSVKSDELLTISGAGKEQIVNFDKDGEKTIYFELKAGSVTGTSTIEVKAEAGSEKGSNIVHLPIRNPNPHVTRVKSIVIPKGESGTIPYELFGAKGSNSSVLELSTINSVDFARRLKFLLQYPHGCIEQIVSGAFPQLYLPSLAELSAEEASKCQANVQSVIMRLRSYQTSDGGFAYWPGGNRSDEWGSNYAGHFMLEAAQKGYTIPQQVKKNWLRYQKNRANSWIPDRSGRYYGDDLVQAYRVFTLALAGETEMGSMNRLRQQANLSNPAKWRLAAAYAYAGLKEVAAELALSLPVSSPEQVYGITYGSPERDLAMVIETHIIMGQREEAAPLVRRLVAKVNSQSWMSTQTTAYSLLAISKYTEQSKPAGGSTKVEYSVNKGRAEKISFSKALLQEVLQLEHEAKGEINIVNASSTELYAQLILSGQPLIDSLSTKSASGITLKVDYLDLENRPIDIACLNQGTDFKVIVTVGNPGVSNIKNIALTQIFPSGWEIRNSRMEEGAAKHEEDQPEYRDIRDDRVYSYFDLNSGQSKRLVILLHASYSGKFFHPAVSVEAMYDHNMRGIEPGRWVEVMQEN